MKVYLPPEQNWVKIIFLKLIRASTGKDIRQRQLKQRLLELAGYGQGEQESFSILLQKLVDNQFLLQEEKEGKIWLDLAHEILIDRWHLFVYWRQMSWQQRQILARIEDAFGFWQKSSINKNLANLELLDSVKSNWDDLECLLDFSIKEFYNKSLEYRNKQAFFKLGPVNLRKNKENVEKVGQTVTAKSENIPYPRSPSFQIKRNESAEKLK